MNKIISILILLSIATFTYGQEAEWLPTSTEDGQYTNGNVGIGTNIPNSKLHILHRQSDLSAGTFGTLNLQPTTAGFYANARSRVITVTGRAFIDYQTDNGGWGTWILGSHYQSVKDILTIKGSTSEITVNGGINVGKDAAAGYLNFRNGAKIGYWNLSGPRNETGDNFSIIFNDGNTNHRYFTINDAGNLGIGTSNPSYPLTLIKDLGTDQGIHQLAKFSRLESGLDNAGMQIHYEADGTNIIRSIVYFPGGSDATFQTFNNSTIDVLHLSANGNVGIGTTTPKNKLSVDGNIWAKKVLVKLEDGADWVFEDDYNLRSLEEVESFIHKNKHLPDIPSAEEFRKNDMDVAEINNKLLQKIEELTLYIIDQNKTIQTQQSEIKKIHELKTSVYQQEEKVKELEQLVKELTNQKTKK